jgi:hypothetical protein
MTKKGWERKYPVIASRDSIVIETRRDSIVYKDTTVFVIIPGETLHDSILIPAQPGQILSDTLKLETSYALAVAYYKSPRVHLSLFQNGIDLNIKLDSALLEKYYWKDKYINVLNQKVTREKYIPGVYRGALWAWVGVIFVLLILIALKLLKYI